MHCANRRGGILANQFENPQPGDSGAPVLQVKQRRRHERVDWPDWHFDLHDSGATVHLAPCTDPLRLRQKIGHDSLGDWPP